MSEPQNTRQSQGAGQASQAAQSPRQSAPPPTPPRPQRLSFWPAWPLPQLPPESPPESQRPLTELAPHPCDYLPGRQATIRAFAAAAISPAEYQSYMDAGFRRSGRMIYQPICRGCRACVPLRVAVGQFMWSKSLRRIFRRNADLKVAIAAPAATAEKWALYERYQRDWHGKPAHETVPFDEFFGFLYDSPTVTREIEYRDCGGRLLGVGICDFCEKSLSSVYFYFDPRERARSLGTFSALCEILQAQRMAIPYWYAGYWIEGCGAMAYKSRFRPCEMLGTDGIWRGSD